MIHVEPDEWAIIQQILGDELPKCYAFGSRVKGTHRPLSDLDLIYFDDIPLERVIEIKQQFDDSDLAFKIDLVNAADSTQDFLQKIKPDCVRL